MKETIHETTFQNCASAVIAFIDSSRYTLSVGMCWCTHPAIFQALLGALKRTVRIKMVLNYDHINFQPQGLNFQLLEKAGAEIFGYPGPGLLHYKFAVADDCRLLTGSYNWTRAEQCDHIVVFHDAVLATQFSKELEKMITKCQTLAQLRNIPPRQICFAQLYRPALWSIHDLRKCVISGAKTWVVAANTAKEWQQWLSTQRHYLIVKCIKTQCFNGDVWDPETFRNWLLKAPIRPTARQLLLRYCFRVQPGDILAAVTSKGKLLAAGIVGSAPEMIDQMPGAVSRFVQWLVLQDSGDDLVVKLPGVKSGITRYKGSSLALIATMERLV